MRTTFLPILMLLAAGCQEGGSVHLDQGLDRVRVDDAAAAEARPDVWRQEARLVDTMRPDGPALSWHTINSGTNTTLSAVWGTGPANVYVVMQAGGILRYNGSSWATAWTPPSASIGMWGIGGSSPQDIYAVGGGTGAVIHYDGVNWSSQDSGSLFPLKDVWANSGTDIFAVGDFGVILHSDGTKWSTMVPSSASGGWLSVSGSGPNNVFAASMTEGLLHYDGTTWSKVSGVICIYGVWVVGPKEAYAAGCGGLVYRFDGTKWNQHSTGVSAGLRDIWAAGNGTVFAAGEQGTIVRYDGSQWSTMTSGVTKRLNGVWGSGPSDVYVVGDSGTILHYGP